MPENSDLYMSAYYHLIKIITVQRPGHSPAWEFAENLENPVGSETQFHFSQFLVVHLHHKLDILGATQPGDFLSPISGIFIVPCAVSRVGDHQQILSVPGAVIDGPYQDSARRDFHRYLVGGKRDILRGRVDLVQNPGRASLQIKNTYDSFRPAADPSHEGVNNGHVSPPEGDRRPAACPCRNIYGT